MTMRLSFIWQIQLFFTTILTVSILTGCGGGNRGDSSIIIGEQEWMTNNLNVTEFRNGDYIPHAESAEDWQLAGEMEIPAWCYYNNDPSTEKEYGKLYNWYAVNDKRKLAPEGWSIPSYNDIMTLGRHLGGVKEAGKKMKVKEPWGLMAGGTNESGFSGKPGGKRDHEGAFSTGATGYWWISNAMKGHPESAWHFSLSSANDFLYVAPHSKGDGYSVRCIKEFQKPER